MKKIITMFLVAAMLTGLVACGDLGTSKETSEKPSEEASEAASETAGESETSEAEKEEAEQVKITIWYEGNDSRLPFFEAAAAEMQKDYPNYSIDAITFDNDTLTTKALQAVTTTGGVDLIFNEASRLVVTHQQSNGGFESLDDILGETPNSEKITDADRKIISAAEGVVVFPVNRSVSGLGYRTDVAGVDVTEDKVPNTFEKFVALGKEYQGAGIAGWTLHLATSPEQVFNLFISGGNSMSDTWLNGVPESQVEKNKEYFEKILGLYAGEDAIWDKDAINEDFAGMYTKIESGSVGMFRVGNWNASGWDGEDSGVGKYAVTTWPSFDDNGKGNLFQGGVRGVALPKNSENKEAAKTFLKYCLSDAAQKASFDTMGSCINYGVVDKDSLTENQKIFFDESIPAYPVDAYEGAFSFYPTLLEVYGKGITNAINSKGADEIKVNVEKIHEELTKAIEENE